MYDIAIIGAGMAGLTCAQQLHQAGYNVLILEKSRGLGGRIATRRLHDTRADHGTCYLKPKGELMQQFVQLLCDRHILKVWTDNSQIQTLTSDFRYVAPAGMNAIAKFLGQGLQIWRSQRVIAIALNESSWQLSLESAHPEATANQPSEISAKAVVFAIPAPQALTILEPLTALSTLCHQLRSVEFNPCLSVIAGYSTQLEPKPDWQAVSFADNPHLAWIGWDSSKHLEKTELEKTEREKTRNYEVFVLQSSAKFARHYLEDRDLQPAGSELLVKASECLLPWLAKPEWMQVHRWRYAFPNRPLEQSYITAETTLPLVCCGDWCGGNLVEGAMHSGIAAAAEINQQMEGRSLPGDNFLQAIAAK